MRSPQSPPLAVGAAARHARWAAAPATAATALLLLRPACACVRVFSLARPFHDHGQQTDGRPTRPGPDRERMTGGAESLERRRGGGDDGGNADAGGGERREGKQREEEREERIARGEKKRREKRRGGERERGREGSGWRASEPVQKTATAVLLHSKRKRERRRRCRLPLLLAAPALPPSLRQPLV